ATVRRGLSLVFASGRRESVSPRRGTATLGVRRPAPPLHLHVLARPTARRRDGVLAGRRPALHVSAFRRLTHSVLSLYPRPRQAIPGGVFHGFVGPYHRGTRVGLQSPDVRPEFFASVRGVAASPRPFPLTSPCGANTLVRRYRLRSGHRRPCGSVSRAGPSIISHPGPAVYSVAGADVGADGNRQ